jgi:hypothetical protein
MMDPWIESHQSLRDHPKLFRLMSRLKIGRAQAIGHLHLLWGWSITYALDGEITRYSAEEIAHAADWLGNAQEFSQALIESRFVDSSELGRSIHDWMDYCGALIDKRLERRAKAQLGGVRRQELLKSQNAYNAAAAREEMSPVREPRGSDSFPRGSLPTGPTNPTLPTGPTAKSPAREPLRVPDTPQNRILYVIKQLQGYPITDANWDATYLEHYKDDVDKLLKFFAGDWKKAGQCAAGIVKELKAKDLSWSIKTIINRAPDWRKRHE